MNKQKAYLSSREVEALLGISRSTLDRWAKDGTLKFFRLPSGQRRFFRSEIEAILKNKWIFLGFFDAMTIQVSIPVRFNAWKICDIVDLNQGISPREKTKTKNYFTFERYFQDISSMTGRYLINALNLFKKRVDLLIFQRYYIQKVKSYYPLLSLKFSIFNSLFFII